MGKESKWVTGKTLPGQLTIETLRTDQWWSRFASKFSARIFKIAKSSLTPYTTAIGFILPKIIGNENVEMRTCETKFIKYILFLFNLIFAISGIGLIVAGSLVLADIGEYSHFMEGRIIAPPIVLIVAGTIVFIVAFLGCYGAIRENYYMLMAFAVLLLIIFIIELAVGIAAAVYKNDFRIILKESMKGSMEKYHESKVDRIAWDNVQSKLECCGVDSPLDWPDKRRPYTCCHSTTANADPPEDIHCQSALPNDDYLYSIGCFEKLEMKANMNAKILIGVGIGIAFVQVIGILLACWLASAVKNKE